MTESKSASHRHPVPRVFISSTAEDLEPYRDAAKEAVLAAEMLPIMFEYFPAADNPPLKECRERVSKADLLIVLVAHRYGWVPVDQPDTSPRKSITWLECQQAVDDGHKVLAFFIGHDGDWPAEMKESYRLVKASDEGILTPKLVVEIQQSVKGLQEFQKWLNERGIRKKVQMPDELQAEIHVALARWRSDHPDFEAPPAFAITLTTPVKYLKTLQDACSYIDIRGLVVGSGTAHRFPIEDLYMALQFRRQESDSRLFSKRRLGTENTRKTQGDFVLHREVSIQTALMEQRLVVIGDPGAGKTTFLRRIAAALCLTQLGTEPNAALSRLGISDKTFPIFLRCATLANHIAASYGRNGAPTELTSPAWLAHVLATESKEKVSGLDESFFQRHLETGRCTILLDGLDEAPDRAQRDRLSQFVENATQTYRDCRFVITSRPVAYTENAILPQFTHLEIAPLSNESVETFLAHWCRKLYGEETPAAKNHTRELLDALHARPEIRRVARNPVMLTALAVVHWNERRLPEQRADLYDSVITWLSRSRENRPGREKPERTVTLLQELALAMQDHPDGRRTQVSKRWAAEQLASFFGRRKLTAKSIEAAERFLTDEELDSGIVVALGNNVRFWHLQFQEYLAARAIAGLPDIEQNQRIGGKSLKMYNPEWREVILLLAGALLKQGEAKVGSFVNQILDGLPKNGATPHPKAEPHLAAEARCAALLGAVFHDLRPYGYLPTQPRYEALLFRVMAIFDRIGSQSVSESVRIKAAEALGQVGDSRLTPNAEKRWVNIAAGSFLMGAQRSASGETNYDEDAENYEIPLHKVTLDRFSFARFPVTVGEYQKFLEDGGYSNQDYWVNGGGFGQFTEPSGWPEQQEFPNRPVVGVSWHEAMAYCTWDKNRLPTEAEWERAARGTIGRKYPWGNDPADAKRLNFMGNVGSPTPVGIYPLGATPDGIEDLAGNVWYWCYDWYGPYSEDPQLNPTGPKNGHGRVVRGGSWSNRARSARSALRELLAPGDRSNNLGFRVVSGVRAS